MAPIDTIETLILCGGLGTRLRSAVPDRPKALAQVAGRPFLDILLLELLGQGLRRFILCVGHGAQQIISHYASRADAQFRFSVENSPLGTAGAVANALPLVHGDCFFVMNGDSLCPTSYAALLASHLANGAWLTMVGTPPQDRADVGVIRADSANRVVEFAEKPASKPVGVPYVNAGVYVLNRSVFRDATSAPFSLESDLFPRLVASGRCFVFPASGPVIDIGTPERWQAANEQLR